MLFFGNLSNVVVFSVTCEAIADLSCAIWLTDMSKWQSIMYAICCKVVVYGYLHKTVSAGAALKIYNGKHKKPEIMYSFRPLRYILWLDEMGMTGFACLDAIRHGMYRTLVLYYKAVFSKGFMIHINRLYTRKRFLKSRQSLDFPFLQTLRAWSFFVVLKVKLRANWLAL